MEKLSRYRFHSILGPRYAGRRGQGVKAVAGCLFFFVFVGDEDGQALEHQFTWNTRPRNHD